MQIREGFVAMFSSLLSSLHLESMTQFAREVEEFGFVVLAEEQLGRVSVGNCLDGLHRLAEFERHSLAKAQFDFFVITEGLEDSLGSMLSEVETHDLCRILRR